MAQAEQVLEVLRRDGRVVSFRHLAQAAGISRSWLYRQPELRREIERLRAQPRKSAKPSQPASDSSLRQQLQIYRDEIARLRNENAALKDQLARQLGFARAASVTKTS